MELRKYECYDCHNEFWVDCDADNYPDYCPYCGKMVTKSNGTTITAEIAE